MKRLPEIFFFVFCLFLGLMLRASEEGSPLTDLESPTEFVIELPRDPSISLARIHAREVHDTSYTKQRVACLSAASAIVSAIVTATVTLTLHFTKTCPE